MRRESPQRQEDAEFGKETFSPQRQRAKRPRIEASGFPIPLLTLEYLLGTRGSSTRCQRRGDASWIGHYQNLRLSLWAGDDAAHPNRDPVAAEIGRASCRERE